jgi:GNAT superfamily N-acetyltransferase
MELKILHDKATIFNFLKSNPEVQLYCIGDLDDFFWPGTIWYALIEHDEIKSLALLYTGQETPTFLLFCKEESEYSAQLISKARGYLPQFFNAHLSEGLKEGFGNQNILRYYGKGYKMVLCRKVEDPCDPAIRRLSVSDLDQINVLLVEAYPENWFDGRMLETGKYMGYFIDGRLAGISGIHVYSPEYKVAALGNIATHSAFRGRQIAFKLTNALCHDLQKDVSLIGLNVRCDNEPAINCYKKAGFEIAGSYDECFIRNDRELK